MKGTGKGIREFKKALKEDDDEDEEKRLIFKTSHNSLNSKTYSLLLDPGE